MGLQWNIAFSPENLLYLLRGISTTAMVTAGAFGLCLILGLLVAFGRMSKHRVVSALSWGYIELFRNIPTLVLLFWIFYVLPLLLGMRISPILAGMVTLGLNGSGYMAEDYRAAILAIRKGQVEAALSLGMSRGSVFRKVILPQALRTLVPLLVNRFAALLEWSSLVSAIGVMEIVYRASYLVTAVTAKPVELFTGIAVFYFCTTGGLQLAARQLEARWARNS